MNLIKQKYNFDEIRLAELKYGLSCVYTLVTKLTVMFVFSILLGIAQYFVLFTIFFGLLRSIGCGFHANKSWKCWIISSTIYLASTYLSTIISISFYWSLVLSLVSSIILIYYTPADTKNKPIINKKIRKRKRFLMTIICLIYIASIIFYNNNLINNLIVTAMIVEVIMIIPFTYKIFKEPYNNYINYQRGKREI